MAAVTGRKTHKWGEIFKRYGVEAVPRGVRDSIRVVQGFPHSPASRYAELQQITDGFVGLCVSLPKPYNVHDCHVLRTMARWRGLETEGL